MRADEQEMFAGLPSEEKDPRKSMHVEDVPLPELAPDEAYIGGDGVAPSTSTRCGRRSSSRCRRSGSCKRLGKESVWGKRHDQPFHVMGSDAAGVVLRVGSAVRNWKPGDAGHRPLQLRRRPGPVGARRLDDGDEPAHLGLRVELRRPRRHRASSRPTSSCRSPPTSRGRRPRATRCATRRATG